ncbi:MAG: hypothetical protein HLUCCA13_03480 [Halomonas sp. HL-48]|nr:hypothetical protein [Halomonas sp. HL-48]KPQ25588.1 MAG: hypothetical protein HLUCCA13_03480 [Halomonas sp. HL-48]
MLRIALQNAGGHIVAAFLDMLEFGEIGPDMLDASHDGYNVLVGSTRGDIITFDNSA